MRKTLKLLKKTNIYHAKKSNDLQAEYSQNLKKFMIMRNFTCFSNNLRTKQEEKYYYYKLLSTKANNYYTNFYRVEV